MIPAFVADASLALAWLFADEANSYADAALERLGERSALVPALFHVETANGLLAAERRRRVPPGATDAILGLLAGLPLNTDAEPLENRLGAIVRLARASGLTVYGATYLDLARRAELPLATLDKRLGEAARRVGATRWEP